MRKTALLQRIIKILGISALTILFLACPAEPDDELKVQKQQKAAVSFSVTDISERSVLPHVSLADAASYTLLGGKNGEAETVLESFTGAGTTVSLDPGTWNFTLNAYNSSGGHILEGKVQNKNIDLTGNNQVSFSLSVINSGIGSIQITLNFPTTAEISKISVNGYGASEDFTSITNGSFVYAKNGVAAGDYFVNFELYHGNTMQNVVSELVMVRNNLTSSKTITLVGDDLKPVLTGSVSITGNVLVGDMLAADTGALNGTGAITYQWKRGAVNVGENEGIYIVQAADVGSPITVTVTRNDYFGEVTSSPTAAVPALVSATLNSVTQDGSSTQTTTVLTLSFNQAIPNLTANNITITHSVSGQVIVKGVPAASGTNYTLPISGFTSGGTLTVAVAKPGYSMSGSPKTDITIYCFTPPPVNAVQPIIIVQPSNSLSQLGMLWISFYVTDGGLTSLQWYKNTVNNTSTGTAISRATSVNYTPFETGYYYAVVTNTITDNGDGGTKTAQTTSNIVYITVGNTMQAEWARTVDINVQGNPYNISDSRFKAMAVDSTGNVYVAGYSYAGTYTYGAGGISTPGGGSTLVKYNSSGTAQWVRLSEPGYFDSRFDAVAVDSSGNIYVAGHQHGDFVHTYAVGVSVGTNAGSSSSDVSERVVLVKYNSSGTAQWARSVDRGSDATGGTNSKFNAVAADSFGNVYAAGYQESPRTYTYGDGVSLKGVYSTNVVLVKYDSSGKALWVQTGDYSMFNAVAVDSSGNVYVAGYVERYTSGNTNNVIALLVKYDSSGTKLWEQTGSSNSRSLFYALAVDSSNNVYAAGFQEGTGAYTYGAVSASGASSKRNVLLVKYNSSGTAQWARSTTDDVQDGGSQFNAVAVDSSGNVYAAGHGDNGFSSSLDLSSSYDDYFYSNYGFCLLVKYDSSGTVQQARTGNYTSQFRAVVLDSSGNVYAAGCQDGAWNRTIPYTYGTGVSVQSSNTATNTSWEMMYNGVLVKYKK